MARHAEFNPQWISPPGATIASLLRTRGITQADLAEWIDWSLADVESLISGSSEITKSVATELANFFGGSVDFWCKREEQYRESLQELYSNASTACAQEWLSELPTSDMIRLGWIERSSDSNRLAAQALRFFGVRDVDSWREAYKDALKIASFRTSESFDSNPAAVTAWIRQGDLLGAEIECAQWQPAKFENSLPIIRELTRLRDPAEFLPKLVQICGSCGVALVVLKAPKDCKASGAAKVLSPARSLILLSGRHLSDDHFWFTFFHEAGHLLLHADKGLFVDGEDEQTSIEEQQANQFAATCLIPASLQAELRTLRRTPMPIARFAKKAGISAGIVVGQLQHQKLVRHDRLNRLKRRFKWSSTRAPFILEMA